MFNDPENQICPESSQDLDDLAHDDLTAKENAKKASDAINANDDDGLVLGELFGEALTIVKPKLKHGEYGNFCKDELHRSSSSCSLYVRIYESRADVRPALAWAAKTEHPLAHRRSVREVLKVITDWKKASYADGAPAPEAPQKPSRDIAQLTRLLELANDEFIAMRDSLSWEDEARAVDLVAALSVNDMTAIDELAGIARDYHWRLGDLVEIEMSTAVRLSLPAPAVSADAHQ
jgi:hypothetical protein